MRSAGDEDRTLALPHLDRSAERLAGVVDPAREAMHLRKVLGCEPACLTVVGRSGQLDGRFREVPGPAVVPAPGVDVTSIRPWCSRTIPYEMARPSPVPCGLVV